MQCKEAAKAAHIRQHIGRKGAADSSFHQRNSTVASVNIDTGRLVGIGHHARKYTVCREWVSSRGGFMNK